MMIRHNRHTISMLGLTLLLALPSFAHGSTPLSAAQQLHDGMRRLWTEHVVWTREYVVAAVAGTPDAESAAKRLMKNQEDIGHAIVPFYGQAAGDKLTSLLKEHITIAVDVVKAAKSNNQNALGEANRRWKQNATDIAAFLAKANPNWPEAALVDAMNMHLETTTREVVARLQHKYDEDVAAFDAVYEHILHMSDVLADGIVKQFPDRFAK